MLKSIACLFITVLLIIINPHTFAWQDDGPVKVRVPIPNMEVATTLRTRGDLDNKLDSNLTLLVEQFQRTRGESSPKWFGDEELGRFFGQRVLDETPSISIAITVSNTAEIDFKDLNEDGFLLRSQHENTLYGSANVEDIPLLARTPGVTSIAVLKAATVPLIPGTSVDAMPMAGLRGLSRLPESNFERETLTGKGVIVGVVDTGIDWRHPDFRNPDGTTRILYIWDCYDQSWADSGGTVGSSPPFNWQGGAPIGTLYTREQINDALQGKGEVNSTDNFGHGTACASTAAGNGRGAPSGFTSAELAGVAPQADLIIVDAEHPDVAGGIQDISYTGIQWIIDRANALSLPVVINCSFGGHFSSHDGTDPVEKKLDQMSGRGKPGVAICVSAGNDRQENLHANGRFGPRQEGQVDHIDVRGTVLHVDTATFLLAYFDHADHWALGIEGLRDTLIAKDSKKKAQLIVFYTRKFLLWGEPVRGEELFADFKKRLKVDSNDQTDRVMVPLPAGTYLVYAYGDDATVSSGAYSLYLPVPQQAYFGRGAVKEQMIGTPGNAGFVVTVGSYDFRASWPNKSTKLSRANLDIGNISDYSSPGFRRDGIVKPDIVGPGQYTISALATGSKMGAVGDGFVLPGGKYLAWSGTSASTPYVAGVIALMLQKNPNLDAAEIKEILKQSAITDEFTGAVPNPDWGWGKIDPAEAIHQTPPAGD